MLFLNSDDINKCLSMHDALGAVKDACLIQESSIFNMPDRMHIEDNDNVFLLMPAIAAEYITTKLVSVFPGNIKKGEPLIHGLVILNNRATGKPLALIDGSALTIMRTAAVGSLGIQHTTPEHTETLGLIGAGVQGFQQVLFACKVRKIKKVFIHDPHHSNLADVIIKLKKQLPFVSIKITDSAEELIKSSECIITATTSNTPVLPNDTSLLYGKHFIGIGSFRPDMHEFPDGLFPLLSEVIIDTELAKKETGDICIPLENNLLADKQILRLGQLINKEKQIDINKTTFFKSVGMALFDLMTAKTIYEKAIEKGIGTNIDF